MPIPTLDFETYSEAGYVWSEPSDKYPLGRWVPPLGADKPGLAAVGSAVYARHPTTEVLTVSYDLCDGRGIRRWQPGQPPPQDLFDHVAAGRPLESHHAMFERDVWMEVCVVKYGWPPLPPEVQRCSMATAHVAQYPGALANLGDVLDLTEKKDKRGSDLIKRFCVPQQPIPGLVDKRTGKVKRPDVPAHRVYPHDDPAAFEELCAYCDQDVRTEMAAADRMPPMEPDELSFWQIDQDVNWRGLGVDRPGLRACIDILGQVLDQYGAECEQITGFKVTQLQKLIGWIAAHGVHTTSLDAPTTAMLLERPDLPAPVERVLRLRQATGSASVKKTYAMENQCASDDRLRNLIVHHGARTGRPTGEGPQPLNLPKNGPKLVWCDCGRPHVLQPFCPWCGALGRADRRAAWQPDMVDHVLEIMGCGSLAMVERFFGDAMQCIQGCVRGLFVAGPGNDLVASDYSAIEAVVAAMLAGEQWRIEAFERGDPIYLVGASKITGTPLAAYLQYKDEHGDHHPDRQKIGKVSELACFSPETQVLTDRGYVAIVDVLIDDKLWDGVQWVRHHGLIAKGVRSVVNLDGVRMTPDHQVNVNGSWKAAWQLVSCESTMHQALVTGSANLPSCVLSRQTESSCNVRVAQRRTSSLKATCGERNLPGAAPARARRLVPIARCILATQTSLRMTKTGGGCLTELRHVSPDASQARRIPGTAITLGVEFAFTSRGEQAQPDVERFWLTSSHWKAGTGLNWNWIESRLMAITSRATFGLSRVKPILKINDQSSRCRRKSTRSKSCSLTQSPVYDIAYAGPRNRFTIKTDTGCLLVHNCGFGGWINSYKAFGSTEPDDVIKAQILAWRAASPAIVEAWGGQWRGPPWRRERQELYGFEGMFVAAVQNPGQIFAYRGIRFCMEEPDCLVVRLLSGRPLRYRSPRLHPSARNPDELTITYMTWNSNPKYGMLGWVPMNTYGGRIFENIVQAVAHDVQRHGIRLLRQHGYPLVLGVYDEDVVEVPKDKQPTLGLAPVDGLDPLVQEVEYLMGRMPDWAAGWPITASGGWRGRRYRKG